MRGWRSKSNSPGMYGMSFVVAKVTPISAGNTIAATVRADETAGEIEEALGEGFAVMDVCVARLPDPEPTWSPMEARNEEER